MRMRTVSAVALALVFTGVHAQNPGQGSKLGPPLFVAKDVEDVSWSPNGKAIVYVQSAKDGKALGVYDLELDKAATVRKLAQDEKLLDLVWLGGGRQALAVIQKGSVEPESILCNLDAAAQSSTVLWSRKATGTQRIDVHLTPSPLLEHSLVWIVTSVPGAAPEAARAQVEEDWVVLQGGKRIVRANDVTAAKNQGYYFSDWSRDGSAIFVGSEALVTVAGSGQRAGLTQDFQVEATAISQVAYGDGRAVAVIQPAFTFRIGRHAIAPGTVVLECMPSNAVVRQVRYPGPFVADATEPKSEHKAVPQLLREGDKSEGVRSLWLVSKDGKSGRSPILVSAQADAEWLAPQENAIAFVWNGVLFVRHLKSS